MNAFYSEQVLVGAGESAVKMSKDDDLDSSVPASGTADWRQHKLDQQVIDILSGLQHII